VRYISTRGQTAPHSFTEAVRAGLAPDGGLFLPASMPDLSAELSHYRGLSYPELAAAFLSKFGPEISLETWGELATQAYAGFSHPDVAPLVSLDSQLHVLELAHGPTLAFKDFALQLLGLLYKRQVEQTNLPLAVLGATSGDTGSAAIHGCLGRDGIRIFILYPESGVAPLQERQMACTGAPNVFAIPVPGTFDDAQAIVKEIFGDAEFVHQVNLSAVNSINIARVLAQCVYYIWAWLRLEERIGPAEASRAEFVVPTGNFGNILAGWMAQQFRLLPETVRFRVATNQNDILYRFFTTGDYQPATVSKSHAPSMDIQAASNFERFLYFQIGEDPVKIRDLMARIKREETIHLDLPAHTFRASRMDDSQIPKAIADVWNKYGYAMDPHTACGYTDLAEDRPSILLATASPAKFPEVVTAATGQEPISASLEVLKDKPLVRHPLPADSAHVKDFILQHTGSDCSS
jgi:threonine synthase